MHLKKILAPTLCTVLFTFFMLLPTLATATGPGQVKDSSKTGHSGGNFPIAQINDSEITWAKLEGKMREIATRNYGRQDITPALAEQIKQKSLDQLITEELSFQRAKSIEIKVSPEEIASHIAQLEKNWGGATHYEKYMELRGWNSQDVRQEAERTLMIKGAINKEVFSKIKVDEQLLKKIYDTNRQRYIHQEQVEITDVIFFLDPEAADTQAKAEEIRSRIINELDKNPAKLKTDGTFAIQEKIKISKKESPALYRKAKELDENDISLPFIADGTLHVIQLTGYKPRTEQTFEQVKQELKGEIVESEKRARLKKWLADLRIGAKIEIVGEK